MLTALVLAPVWQVSTTSIFNAVNRLHSRTRQLQVADLVPAFVRTSLTAALALLGGLTPLTALVAVLVAHLAQYGVVRSQVLPVLGDVQPTGIADHTARIWEVVHQLLPNCIFICIQGQLATCSPLLWNLKRTAARSRISGR